MKNMKNVTRTSVIIFLLSVSLFSCTQKTATVNKKSTSSSGNGSSTINDGGGTITDPVDGTGSVSGCNGVYRSGATSCYYTNLPRVVMSGPGTNGVTWWSSNSLPASISPSQFRTDASFSVRIKPSWPIGNESSRQGRKCSPYLVSNFNKLKVQVMLRRSVDSIGEVKELSGTVNSYSNTARFTVPGGTSDPYILEVIGVTSDHRCNTAIYGNLPANLVTSCTNGLLLDIPTRTPTTVMTECVAFNIEMATDSTYDLPN